MSTCVAPLLWKHSVQPRPRLRTASLSWTVEELKQVNWRIWYLCLAIRFILSMPCPIFKGVWRNGEKLGEYWTQHFLSARASSRHRKSPSVLISIIILGQTIHKTCLWLPIPKRHSETSVKGVKIRQICKNKSVFVPRQQVVVWKRVNCLCKDHQVMDNTRPDLTHPVYTSPVSVSSRSWHIEEAEALLLASIVDNILPDSKFVTYPRLAKKLHWSQSQSSPQEQLLSWIYLTTYAHIKCQRWCLTPSPSHSGFWYMRHLIYCWVYIPNQSSPFF